MHPDSHLRPPAPAESDPDATHPLRLPPPLATPAHSLVLAAPVARLASALSIDRPAYRPAAPPRPEQPPPGLEIQAVKNAEPPEIQNLLRQVEASSRPFHVKQNECAAAAPSKRTSWVLLVEMHSRGAPTALDTRPGVGLEIFCWLLRVGCRIAMHFCRSAPDQRRNRVRNDASLSPR